MSAADPNDKPSERLTGLVRRIRAAPWFAAINDALSEAALADGRTYLEGLGFDDADVATARGWADALAKSTDRNWDPAWWAAEEQRRNVLSKAALAAFGEDPALAALSEINTEAMELTQGGAALAAARADLADAAMIRAASGSATMTCYQAALEVLAGNTGQSPFLAKFRLFEAGRWPLCVVGNTFFVL